MDTKIIIANMKMNLTKEKIEEYLNIFDLNNESIIFCPTSIYLEDFIKKGYKTGIQNISTEEYGAYTGEISARQASSINVEYVLIGHSERRQIFNETDQDINKKIQIALKNSLKVILCIGETKEERDNNKTNEVLENQINVDLNNINENVIIAYEPVWSIGTGITPTNEQIYDTINFIKEKTNKKVLYGGSVNLNNINELNTIMNIDGYLVGGASLNPKEFEKMCLDTLK